MVVGICNEPHVFLKPPGYIPDFFAQWIRIDCSGLFPKFIFIFSLIFSIFIVHYVGYILFSVWEGSMQLQQHKRFPLWVIKF